MNTIKIKEVYSVELFHFTKRFLYLMLCFLYQMHQSLRALSIMLNMQNDEIRCAFDSSCQLPLLFISFSFLFLSLCLNAIKKLLTKYPTRHKSELKKRTKLTQLHMIKCFQADLIQFNFKLFQFLLMCVCMTCCVCASVHATVWTDRLSHTRANKHYLWTPSPPPPSCQIPRKRQKKLHCMPAKRRKSQFYFEVEMTQRRPACPVCYKWTLCLQTG